MCGLDALSWANFTIHHSKSYLPDFLNCSLDAYKWFVKMDCACLVLFVCGWVCCLESAVDTPNVGGDSKRHRHFRTPLLHHHIQNCIYDNILP